MAFPEAPRAGPGCPRCKSRAPASTREIQEVLPSRLDEALFRSGVSRLITPNLWNIQRVLHTLAETHEVSRHTRFHSRGSTRVPPTSRGTPFPPPSSSGGILPYVVGKEFLVFPSHLKRRRSPQERREELQGRATIPRVPQISQSIPGKTVFPALPRRSSRVSTHTTVARGTALSESLVGKPRGKATDPLIHAKGSVTLLLQFGKKFHVHAPTRDED